MAPEDTRMICWPRLRMRRRSCASASSQVRFNLPVFWSHQQCRTYLDHDTARLDEAGKAGAAGFGTGLHGSPTIAAAPPLLTVMAGPNIVATAGIGATVGRDYEPVKGQWYENVEDDETFRVLSVDEDAELVEIEYLDGDIEELDIDSWHEMDLERIAEPEGWAAQEESDEEEDDDEEEDEEDEDDDDWDDDDDEDDDDWEDEEDDNDRY